MKKSCAGKPYTGVLAKPLRYIPRSRVPLSWLVDRQDARSLQERLSQAVIEERAKAQAAKLPALFAHYGIDQDDYAALAAALASEHVPGFKFERAPVGAEPTWSPWTTALLFLHIEQVAESLPRKSFVQAALRVAKGGIWNSILRRGTGRSGATLLRRARSANRAVVEAIRADYNRGSGKTSIDAYVASELKQIVM